MLAAAALPAAAVLWGWRGALLVARLRSRSRRWSPARSRSTGARRERALAAPRPAAPCGRRCTASTLYNLVMGAGTGCDHRVPAPVRARGRGAERRGRRFGDDRRGRGRAASCGSIASRWSETHWGYPDSMAGFAAVAAPPAWPDARRPAAGPVRRSGSSAAMWGAGGLGFGAISMLAVMAEADEARTGRASGMVVLLVQPRLQRRPAAVRLVGRAHRRLRARDRRDRRPLRRSRRDPDGRLAPLFRPVSRTIEVATPGAARAPRPRSSRSRLYFQRHSDSFSMTSRTRPDMIASTREAEIDRRDTVAR